MKTYAKFVMVITAVLAMEPAVRAQTCSSPITSWEGNYTLAASGTATEGSDVYGISNSSALVVSLPSQGGSCQIWQWEGGGAANVSDTGSLNDTLKIHNECTAGDFVLRETLVGTNASPSADFSISALRVDTSKGTYFFDALPAVTVNQTIFNCNGTKTLTSGNGYTNYPETNWPLTFPLPSTVQSLTVNNFGFQAVSFFEGSSTAPTIPWTFSFTLDPIVKIDDACPLYSNSSIGCQNQSLGEDVPVVGTGFQLHYEGARAPGAGAGSVASADAFMIGGWTLSVHHAYDGANNALFLGDGRQRSAWQLGTPVTLNGNRLLTSEDGSEVYVFSGSTGLHVQTVRPLTGALVYQFGYDSAGNLVTVTDASGNVTTIHRDASEHATSIVSPYGQTTILSVDSNGFLSHVTDPLGKSVTFTNTRTGLLTARTDENGNTFTYTYDAQGRLTKDADPAGGFTALSRTQASSGLGWTVAETTATGRTMGFQSTLTVPWVQNSTSTYSEQLKNTLPNGLTTTKSNTQHGAALSKSFTLPDGTSDSDTQGPDPVWGIEVPVTTSETHTEGSLTMSITGSRTAALGTAGNPFTLTSETDKRSINSRTYASAFTTSNRTIVETSPVGRKVTTVLDTKERIASTQIAGLLANSLAYDSRGRVSTVTQGTRNTTITYDTDGRPASVTDPLGRKNSFVYDADGRLLSTTLADGRIIDYQHDANGNLTAVIPPGKSGHDFDYTSVNLMSEYLPPAESGTGPTTYTYNADRDLTKLTRPDGKTVTFDYDSAGRLSSTITPTETVDYGYSSTTGNLASASITSGEALAYGYNGPLPASTQWTGTITGTVSRVYDNNFWITSRSLNGGNTIAFSHDNDGLLTKAGALTLNRSSQNSLITGTAAGLATDTRTYDSFGELTGYTASYNGSALYSVTYTRDAGGRVGSKTESIGGHTNTYAYSYDIAGRLIGVAQNGTSISSYSYDTNSNRLKGTTSSGTANGTYDAQDRLLTYGTAAYTYTANGELAGQTVGAQKTTYQYDVLGNLSAVTLPSGTAISYVVDAENRRIGKKLNGVLAGGFLYDGHRIVAQLNGSNAIVSQFVYASRSTAPDYMVSGGVTYRIFSDQLGSPRVVVNAASGAIAEEITYDEFGNVISDTKPGFQPFGFAGGLYDQDTKLVRFGARDYDASTGRWTAKDPIRFSGGDTNLYGYVLSDPVNGIDPMGLEWPNLVKAAANKVAEAAKEVAEEVGKAVIDKLKEAFSQDPEDTDETIQGDPGGEAIKLNLEAAKRKCDSVEPYHRPVLDDWITGANSLHDPGPKAPNPGPAPSNPGPKSPFPTPDLDGRP